MEAPGTLRRVAAGLASRRRRGLGIALLAVLVVGLGANMVRRVYKGSSAFDDTLAFSRELVYEGVNVYETHGHQGTHTKYPPFFFLFAAPFAALPLPVAAALWYLLNLGLAIAAAAWSVRAVRTRGAASPTVGETALPLILVAVLVVTNLQRGQVNLTVLALVCAAIFLASRRRDLAAGIVLGIAVALKLTPALLLLWLLWRRAWRVGLGVVLALAVCWGLLPALVFGPGDAVALSRSWSGVVAGFGEQGALGEGLGGFRATNQSLGAAVHRYFTAVEALPEADGRAGFSVSVVSLDPCSGAVEIGVKTLSLLLLGALAWLMRRPLADRRAPAFGLEASLVLVATLVVSPISWINHFVALLFPYAAVLEAIRSHPGGRPPPCGATAGVVLSCGLVSSSVVLWLLAFSLPLLGALLLGAVLVCLHVRAQRAAPREGARGMLRPA